MDAEFIDLTPENIEDEHLCCIIRTKKGHPGIEAKRAWLKERLREGHVFRKLNVKGCAFISMRHWNGMGAGRRRQLLLYLLPLGSGRTQRARVRTSADGELH